MTGCSRAPESFRTGGIPSSCGFSTDIIEVVENVVSVAQPRGRRQRDGRCPHVINEAHYKHVIVRLVVIATLEFFNVMSLESFFSERLESFQLNWQGSGI